MWRWTKKTTPGSSGARWRALSRSRSAPPPRPRQGLLVFEDLGVIGVGRKRLLRRAPQPQGFPEVGCLELQAARKPRGDAHVLGHQRELEARGECAGQH